MLVLAAVVVRRQIRFPPHAVIQRQSWGYLPIVLRIQRIVKLTSVEPVDRTLGKGHGTSHHKIGQDRSGRRPVERRCTHGIDAGEVVQSLLIDRSAKPELMRSLDPAKVLNNGGHWSVMLRPWRCGPATKQERGARGCRDGDHG